MSGLELVFTPFINERCFDISIINDSMLEQDMRYFLVNLESSVADVNLSPSTTTVFITDDDGMLSQLSCNRLWTSSVFKLV